MKHHTSLAHCSRRTVLAMGGAAMAAGRVAGVTGDARAQAGDPITQPASRSPETFTARAFEMRDLATALGDQAYGAVIVSATGQIIGQAPSRVVTNKDPTAHAEMEAIRDAARRLGRRDLRGNAIYSSTRPCPMCEAAAYWAGLEKMVYGRNGADGGAPRLCG